MKNRILILLLLLLAAGFTARADVFTQRRNVGEGRRTIEGRTTGWAKQTSEQRNNANAQQTVPQIPAVGTTSRGAMRADYNFGGKANRQSGYTPLYREQSQPNRTQQSSVGGSPMSDYRYGRREDVVLTEPGATTLPRIPTGDNGEHPRQDRVGADPTVDPAPVGDAMPVLSLLVLVLVAVKLIKRD